ncbi:hydrogen peroxide-dependent heme synthase [Alicyclobacillus sp. SO9]|uniref:hydrogen peroxide-dependent heme synthase n=1 Tax=Alicyclobacillus sp. SO9 TaxID=2665646 RepID=UPI0018E7DDA9|nr:hydrogen peroxide-dependent heme synthase [Alicyclobacillus sp. SO9]QQE77507.1 heme-dependent peroxidase [Alicyclobacillus sp. SO9]
MAQAPQTLDGWFVLHDFRKIDWARWKNCSVTEQNQMLDEFQTVLSEFTSVNENHSGTFGVFAIAGHKADLLLLHMRPTVEELEQVKTKLNKTAIADYLTTPYSYVSVVELGGYLAKPGVNPDTDPYLQGRLKPAMPDFSQICFYPMSKKRDGSDNWYTLSESERVDLMRSHGGIGRSYADRIKQIVTGSMGLDDWEWGVTLFSDDPLQFKKIVYEMRFDEASARFGEFGPFYVGYKISDHGLRQLFTV